MKTLKKLMLASLLVMPSVQNTQAFAPFDFVKDLGNDFIVEPVKNTYDWCTQDTRHKVVVATAAATGTAIFCYIWYKNGFTGLPSRLWNLRKNAELLADKTAQVAAFKGKEDDLSKMNIKEYMAHFLNVKKAKEIAAIKAGELAKAMSENTAAENNLSKAQIITPGNYLDTIDLSDMGKPEQASIAKTFQNLFGISITKTN
jgi:hypothetical protein